MLAPFAKRQKVRCVDVGPLPGCTNRHLDKLALGSVYTVLDIWEARATGGWGVQLYEVDSYESLPIFGKIAVGYSDLRFSPILPDWLRELIASPVDIDEKELV